MQLSHDNENALARGAEKTKQFSTFYVSKRLYGIHVTEVQEVVRTMTMTTIPLADNCVRGLINLRGQIATAIGLRELFGLKDSAPQEPMNVVCKCEGNLISLLVDEIGDVIEVSNADYEPTPNTIHEPIRKYMSGVYKLNDTLLSIININQIFTFLNR